MQIYNDLIKIKNSSIALGYFDGVHLGHKVVLKNAIHIANKNNTQSTAIIFKEHPLNFLTDENVAQILTIDEKLNILEKIGLDNVVLLDFKTYSHISAKDYLENILIKYFSPIAITTGFNHYFGFNKEGNSEFLKENQTKFNYKYFEIPPFVVNDNIVSCSLIRNKIQLGNFYEATPLLGYNYFIEGIVIKGEQIASKLGFPSANIIYPENKIKIQHGVYYVKVSLDGNEYNGILNHGFAPTMDNIDKLKTEVHIIDFNRNIYGEKIKISFITKIRNQAKYENTDKLKAQILRDIAFTQIYKYFLKDKINIPCKRLYL